MQETLGKEISGTKWFLVPVSRFISGPSLFIGDEIIPLKSHKLVYVTKLMVSLLVYLWIHLVSFSTFAPLFFIPGTVFKVLGVLIVLR